MIFLPEEGNIPFISYFSNTLICLFRNQFPGQPITVAGSKKSIYRDPEQQKSIVKRKDYSPDSIQCWNIKGLKIGGAKISEEHANFIIAERGCTSKDIYDLIGLIKKKVYEKRQITLIEELIYLGEF